MATLKYIRADLSEKEQADIVQAVIDNKKSPEEAAAQLGISTEQFKSVYDSVMKKYNKSPIGYGNDVQKLISYKGTIRELMVSATNKKGGKYPLKVVNIYIKPNTERYYEEESYPVDKERIRNGSPSEGFYPEKALWIKGMPTRVRPKKKTVIPDTIELRKKGKSRPKLRKAIKHRKYPLRK